MNSVQSDIVGTVGRVVTRIRGASGPGEIEMMRNGCIELFIAYSDTVLERGSTVLAIRDRAPRAVDVIEWYDAPDWASASR